MSVSRRIPTEHRRVDESDEKPVPDMHEKLSKRRIEQGHELYEAFYSRRTVLHPETVSRERRLLPGPMCLQVSETIPEIVDKTSG